MNSIIHAFRQCIGRIVAPMRATTIASMSDERFMLHLLRMSTKRKIESLYDESAISAKEIGLTYSSDTVPGISRIMSKDGRFAYIDSHGSKITDTHILHRIASLVIPPAWTSVWICANENGHLQVTGRDARKRKQYRYHPLWNRMRNMSKYHRLTAFGFALPKVRRRIHRDLALPGMPKNKILAVVVELLERTLIRVGNDEYARDNKSYGLTTLRNRHVTICGSTIQFHFRGKSGVHHTIDVTDSRLAKIIRRCKHIPGTRLFEYIDERGHRQNVTSDDVNAYLQHIMGDDFTAKDYRTWRGTVLATQILRKSTSCTSLTHEKSIINQAVKGVAQRLGNTPTVCRKYYIHPCILEAFRKGTIPASFESSTGKRSSLRLEERATLQLLMKG